MKQEKNLNRPSLQRHTHARHRCELARASTITGTAGKEFSQFSHLHPSLGVSVFVLYFFLSIPDALISFLSDTRFCRAHAHAQTAKTRASPDRANAAPLHRGLLALKPLAIIVTTTCQLRTGVARDMAHAHVARQLSNALQAAGGSNCQCRLALPVRGPGCSLSPPTPHRD